VTIVNYRYSGFSWRGPTSWNKDNSTMTTSDGKGRDDANGTPGRWVVVSGPTPKGSASVLMMSAAVEVAGTPEKLRVWDSKTHEGAPFVNFNPVMNKPLPLDDAHPAVSNRKYRVIAADRVIDAAAAEAEWRKWLGK
jgi:type V secretory pathway adhesin AidA